VNSVRKKESPRARGRAPGNFLANFGIVEALDVSACTEGLLALASIDNCLELGIVVPVVEIGR
jgi:hypothetical protein